jgi:hypothetical protein
VHFEKKKKMEKYNTVCIEEVTSKFYTLAVFKNMIKPYAHLPLFLEKSVNANLENKSCIQSGGVKNTFMTFQSLQLESLMKQ